MGISSDYIFRSYTVDGKSKQLISVIREFRRRVKGVNIRRDNDTVWVRETGEKVEVKDLTLQEIRDILWDYGIVYIG